MRVVLFLCVSLVAAGAACARGAAADSAAVAEAVRAYDAAWAARDTAAVGRWLAPEYRYFTSTGGVWSRAQLIELLASPSYEVESARRSELEPRLVGATAIVASRWQGHGTYSGGTFDDDQRCSLVLARRGQGWRLVAEHCTQIRPES